MPTHFRFAWRLLTLAIAAALLTPTVFGTTTASAKPAEGSTQRVGAYYGSIAISDDGSYGTAWDYPRKAGAMARATRACKVHSSYPGTCRPVVWIRNNCAAVSVKYDSRGWVARYRWGTAFTKRAAIAKAQQNFGGRLLAWTCTTR